MADIHFHSSHAQSLTVTALPSLWLDKATTGWHRLLMDVFDPYRPERHYMRGPGPKWHAKHPGHAGKSG